MTGTAEPAAAAIERWASRFKVPISAATRDGLLTYGQLLLTWGQTINLTSAKSLDALISQHFPDAFAIAAKLAELAKSADLAAQFAPGRPQIVDVGSGGGLPALPLALLQPDASLTLFEVTGKKVAFLRMAIRELKLGGRVRVDPVRLALPTPAEGSFDVAMSRATFSPSEWLELGWHLVRPGGVVFALGSHDLKEWPPNLSLTEQSSYRADRWVAELRRST